MQPLDVGVHRALREYLHAQFARKASLRQDISKQNLLATVWPAIRQAMSSKNILAGFRKSGLIPLDATPVLERVTRHMDLLKAERRRKQKRNDANYASDAKSAVPLSGEAQPSSDDLKAASDQRVQQLLVVPQLPEKRKRGGRKSMFPEGGELTSPAAIQTIEAAAKKSKRKSKRKNVAFRTDAESGGAHALQPEEVKQDPGHDAKVPVAERKRDSRPEAAEDEQESADEVHDTVSEGEDEEKTLLEVLAQYSDDDDSKDQAESADQSDTDVEAIFCLPCSKIISGGQARFRCSRCSNFYHNSCGGQPRSLRGLELSELFCLDCKPKPSAGMSLL